MLATTRASAPGVSQASISPVVFEVGHGAGVYPQSVGEIRGLESRGLSQPPDLATDGHLHGDSMGETCGNRKSFLGSTGKQMGQVASPYGQVAVVGRYSQSQAQTRSQASTPGSRVW